MGKRKTKSETLDDSTHETTASEGSETVSVESPQPEESPKPAPKFNGPIISFKNIDVKGGGVVSVTCLDNKVPLGKIQIIAIKGADATYVYRRV